MAEAMVAYSAASITLRGAVAAGVAVDQARTRSGYSTAQRAAAAGPTDAGTADAPATPAPKPSRTMRRRG